MKTEKEITISVAHDFSGHTHLNITSEFFIFGCVLNEVCPPCGPHPQGVLPESEIRELVLFLNDVLDGKA